MPLTSPQGGAYIGQTFRANDPVVLAHPGKFLPKDTPRSEWPNVWSQIEEQRAEIERMRMREEREAFEKAARGNAVKLQAPAVLRATEDILTHVGGRPTLIKKGSTALESDSFVHEHAEACGLYERFPVR